MKRVLRTVIALIVFGGSQAAMAATLHVDTFDADVQGWAGGPLPQYQATGGAGDGGGFILVSASTNLATHNSGPSWTGDFAAIGADRVNVDMMVTPTSSSPLEMRLVLFGPASVSERWTSAVSQVVPNDGVWRNYTFTIGPTDLVHVQGIGDYEQLIVGVVRLMLRFDPGPPNSGGDFTDGTLGVDNIALQSAPVQPIPGDFDGNGHVDGADLTDPTSGFYARFGADLQGNDFLTWQQNLAAAVSTGAVNAVPEPGALVLVLAAAALGIRRRTEST